MNRRLVHKWSLWYDGHGNKFVNKTSAMAKMEEDRMNVKRVKEEKEMEEVKGPKEEEKMEEEKEIKKVKGLKEEKNMTKSFSIPVQEEDGKAKEGQKEENLVPVRCGCEWWGLEATQTILWWCQDSQEDGK